MSFYRRDKVKSQRNRETRQENYFLSKDHHGKLSADRGHMNAMIHKKHKKFLDPTQADDLERRWRLSGAKGGRAKNPVKISLAGPKFEDSPP